LSLDCEQVQNSEFNDAQLENQRRIPQTLKNDGRTASLFSDEEYKDNPDASDRNSHSGDSSAPYTSIKTKESEAPIRWNQQ
jgi:hypothetical protein